MKSDLSFNDKMLYHIACSHVLLISSETILRKIQFSTRDFSQLKKKTPPFMFKYMLNNKRNFANYMYAMTN